MVQRGIAQDDVGRRLLLFGLAVALTHHIGLLTDPLGRVGPTSWNDWLDLLTPYLVVGTALRVLAAGRPDRLAWGLGALGAIAYVQGHGLHLAANSVGNDAPGETAHLWDEVVGHAIWYAGLGLLVLALIRALDAVPLKVAPIGWLVAVGVGLTVASNAVAGGTMAGSLPVSLVLAGYGARRRDALGRLLLATLGAAALILVGALVVDTW